MRFWRMAFAGGFVGLGLCGCEEPNGIVPVTPPGAYIPRESPDKDPSQALGEAAPTAAPTVSQQAKLAEMKLALPTAKGETKTTAGGVKYQTLKEGTGAELKPGQKAKIHYEGKLENGTVFDSTRPSKPPFDVAIGVTGLIKGWEEGIPGMKVGEVRRLTIPPEMGYGKTGRGSEIPPNSTLIFEVELVEIP